MPGPDRWPDTPYVQDANMTIGGMTGYVHQWRRFAPKFTW